MADPLKVLLLTDVFPPGSGGSGWSAYYLGKALQERGHEVRVVRPRYSEGVARVRIRIVEYGGLPVEELLIPEASGWVRRLGLGKASLERTTRLAMTRRAYQIAASGKAGVLHGQHAVSSVAASWAARRARSSGAKVISVATVRDYWPLCPVSTRLFMDSRGQPFECKDCHELRSYLNCTNKSQRKSKMPAALARWGQTLHVSQALARCDAVIAVSDYVRREVVRSGRVPERKLVTIPNLVDLPSVDRALAGSWPLNDISPSEPYLLFVGKWDINKGAQMLPEALARSGVRLPLVLAGDGPLRGQLVAEARERGLDFRFYNWLENDSVIKLMRHARALLFPSAWQEPLSRVLLEGCAAGAAIVALDTGGTGDVIVHKESGWLAPQRVGLAEGTRQVVRNDELNTHLRLGARRQAEVRFAAPLVSERVEALYHTLLARLESA